MVQNIPVYRTRANYVTNPALGFHASAFVCAEDMRTVYPLTNSLLVDSVNRGTILYRGCTHITDGGPTLIQHWFKVSITGTMHCSVLTGCWPAPATVVQQHSARIGLVSY